MESIKISIFQKKNIIQKKKTFKIMFIHSLNLETIQYLCRFHMLKMLLWEVRLRLYSSHMFTTMCLQPVYSWKFEAPWRFVDWEYSEYAATRSWSGTVTTGWIGMERLDMVSAEYPFRSARNEKWYYRHFKSNWNQYCKGQYFNRTLDYQ